MIDPTPTFSPQNPGQTQSSLELLYHISRELATAIDLPTVLEKVVRLSVGAVGAISGSIIVMDEQDDPVDAIIIHGGRVVSRTVEHLRSTLETGLAGWAVRTQQVVLIPNTSTDDRWIKRPDDAPEQTGAKSALAAPLLGRDRVVGVLTVVHPIPGTFNQSHLALFQSIADQAGIAVLNARLYAESQRQARVMTALVESARQITNLLENQDAIFSSILQQVQSALQVEAVCLLLRQGDELEVRAATGPSDPEIGRRTPLNQGLAGWVARKGIPVVAEDLTSHPFYDPQTDHFAGIEPNQIACAPIFAHGEVIGVLQAFNGINHNLGGDELQVLNGIGSLAGSLILHAQLFERLQAANRSFRELFEDSIDPILLTDLRGAVVEANRQAVSTAGMSKENLIGRAISAIHDLPEGDAWDGIFSKMNELPVSYESSLKIGEKKPIQVYARQISLDSRPFIQWILRDLSERKHLDTLREDLIAMVYHDLRSPLANVMYSLEFFRAVLPEDDPTNAQLVDIAVRSIERIQRLTSSLLDLRRLESGKQIQNKVPTQVSTILEGALKAVRPVIENRKQKLEIQTNPDLPAIPVDPDMLQRVLINLLENAAKYTPSNARILVMVEQHPGHLLFAVKDEGAGIPEDKIDLVFDKFQRLQTSGVGVGLGLAFCRLAVESHGGKIWVESELGKGASFKFTLPLQPTH